ncbi:hypothetical protein Tco_0468549 [Tanacetum coccineum]
MLFRGHCCLSLSTDNCNALSPHRHDKLLILVADCFQWLVHYFCSLWNASSIPTVFSWGGSIRPKGFLSFILLLAVIIVAVVMVVLIVADAIIRVVVVVSSVPPKFEA